MTLEFKERISSEETMTQYLSDIRLELEAIKVHAWKNSDQILLNKIERIDTSLLGMMDITLDLAESVKNLN